jgi:hypothetical protein
MPSAKNNQNRETRQRPASKNRCSSELIGAPLPFSLDPEEWRNLNFAKRTQEVADSKGTPQKNEPGKTQERHRITKFSPSITQAEPGRLANENLCKAVDLPLAPMTLARAPRTYQNKATE